MKDLSTRLVSHSPSGAADAQDELRLYREIVLQMAEGVCLVRAKDATIVYANPRFERMFGYEPGELENLPVATLNAQASNEHTPAQVAQEIIRTLEAQGEWAGEILNMKKDGTPFWSYVRITTFEHHQHGKVWIAVHSEITSRKQAEQKLNQLAAIVESSGDAIISKGLDGSILSWNRGAERMFGYSAEEIIGKPITVLFPEDRIEEESDILKRIRAGESLIHYESVRLRKGGEPIHVSLTVSPIHDINGQVVGASNIARDMTARKRAEASLQRARAELERQVQERTAELQKALHEKEALLRELQDKIADLETFEEVVVGRELKMMMLEKELAKWRAQNPPVT